MEMENSLNAALSQLIALQSQQLNAINGLANRMDNRNMEQNNLAYSAGQENSPTNNYVGDNSSAAISNPFNPGGRNGNVNFVGNTGNINYANAPMNANYLGGYNQYASQYNKTLAPMFAPSPQTQQFASQANMYMTNAGKLSNSNNWSFWTDFGRMNQKSRDLHTADVAMQQSSGALSAVGSGANLLADIGTTSLLGSAGMGFLGSMAGGAIVGAAVGYTVDAAVKGGQEAAAYNKYLLENSYRFIDLSESSNDRDLGGFNRSERWQAAKWLRHANTDLRITDDETASLLTQFTEGNLLKQTSDLETFQKRYSELVKFTKESALMLNQSYEETAGLMSELEKAGIGANYATSLASQSRVLSSLTGNSASDVSSFLVSSAENLTSGTSSDTRNVMEQTSMGYMYSDRYFEFARDDKDSGSNTSRSSQLSYNYVTNVGGTENYTQQMMQYASKTMTGDMFSPYSVLFYDYDKSSKQFMFNQDSFNSIINSGYDITQLADMTSQKLNGLSIDQRGVWDLNKGNYLQSDLSFEQMTSFIGNIMDAMTRITGEEYGVSLTDSYATKNRLLLGDNSDEGREFGSYLDYIAADDGKMAQEYNAAAVQEKIIAELNSNRHGFGSDLNNFFEEVKDGIGDMGQSFADFFDKIGIDIDDFWTGKKYTEYGNTSWEFNKNVYENAGLSEDKIIETKNDLSEMGVNVDAIDNYIKTVSDINNTAELDTGGLQGVSLSGIKSLIATEKNDTEHEAPNSMLTYVNNMDNEAAVLFNNRGVIKTKNGQGIIQTSGSNPFGYDKYAPTLMSEWFDSLDESKQMTTGGVSDALNATAIKEDRVEVETELRNNLKTMFGLSSQTSDEDLKNITYDRINQLQKDGAFTRKGFMNLSQTDQASLLVLLSQAGGAFGIKDYDFRDYVLPLYDQTAGFMSDLYGTRLGGEIRMDSDRTEGVSYDDLVEGIINNDSQIVAGEYYGSLMGGVTGRYDKEIKLDKNAAWSMIAVSMLSDNIDDRSGTGMTFGELSENWASQISEIEEKRNDISSQIQKDKNLFSERMGDGSFKDYDEYVLNTYYSALSGDKDAIEKLITIQEQDKTSGLNRLGFLDTFDTRMEYLPSKGEYMTMYSKKLLSPEEMKKMFEDNENLNSATIDIKTLANSGEDLQNMYGKISQGFMVIASKSDGSFGLTTAEVNKLTTGGDQIIDKNDNYDEINSGINAVSSYMAYSWINDAFYGNLDESKSFSAYEEAFGSTAADNLRISLSQYASGLDMTDSDAVQEVVNKLTNEIMMASAEALSKPTETESSDETTSAEGFNNGMDSISGSVSDLTKKTESTATAIKEALTPTMKALEEAADVATKAKQTAEDALAAVRGS